MNGRSLLLHCSSVQPKTIWYCISEQQMVLVQIISSVDTLVIQTEGKKQEYLHTP